LPASACIPKNVRLPRRTWTNGRSSFCHYFGSLSAPRTRTHAARLAL
jgi:hypothetical protein